MVHAAMPGVPWLLLLPPLHVHLHPAPPALHCTALPACCPPLPACWPPFQAVTFLKRIKEVVEDPRRLLLDV